jgi:hypothetical protein
MMFSVYLDKSSHRDSSVMFGSYDLEGVNEDEAFTVV